ncbi:MAG TPA: hypothetical protein VJX67_15870, partial [Blastocatellia bacterium]|nr:hypothetical protein [Blastocatellia bacterium]
MNRSAVLVFLALLIIVRSASPASARLVLASPRIAEVAGSPPAGHDTVTIMPFENLSGRPEYNWIGEAFAVELAALLDTPELSAIQPDERDVAFKEGGLPPAAILTHATMFKIAERAGANLVVIGSYRITGEGRASNITFTARTVNINEGMLMGREQNAGGPLLEFERMLGELAYEILYQHNSTIPYS